jgi:hypothetical protein
MGTSSTFHRPAPYAVAVARAVTVPPGHRPDVCRTLGGGRLTGGL